MSISLIVRDRLWGLISCLNHTRPWRVFQEMRMACEFLGRLTSLQIAALEDRDQLGKRASRRTTEEELARAMHESAPDENVLEVLLTRPTELMGIVGAEGVAVVSGGEVSVAGHAPPPALIQDIAAWVERDEREEREEREEKQESAPFATTSLATRFPPAREAGDVASGLLTFALPGAPQRRLLWFRPEFIQTVSWGGDPNKAVAGDSGGSLRPRQSFALWREEVRLRSHPWTASDLEAADELRRRAIEIDVARRFLNEQRAVRARNDLLAVVSHDLRGPLSGVLLQAEVMLHVTGTADRGADILRGSAERIRRAAVHMNALTDDLLDLASIEAHRFALHLRSVESRELVEEAVLGASPLAEAKRITLAL